MQIDGIDLDSFNGIAFDCDGVLLDSNRIKHNAFISLASGFDDTVQSEFLKFHKKNNGLSRFEKISYLVDLVTSGLGVDFKDKIEKELHIKFSLKIREGLRECEVAPGIKSLKMKLKDVPWFVVSASYENELHDILEEKGLFEYFQGGIFGSPRNKFEIFHDLIETGKMKHPILFIGDSLLDYEAAKFFKLKFIFLTKWTYFDSWQYDLPKENITIMNDLSDIENLKS